MKRIFLLFSLMVAVSVGAQTQRVSFVFQGGLDSQPSLKSTMQSTLSSFLTEINKACREKRPLRLQQFKMSERARQSLTNFWTKFARFSCDDQTNVSKCLRTVNGYEVREIYVSLFPIDPTQFKDNLNRELVVGFTRDGTITSAHMAMENNSIGDIINQGMDVTDVRRRTEILNFVEEFRSFYDEKDLAGLRQVFDDDALIITGKVVMRQPRGDLHAQPRPEVIYNSMDKEEYMTSLAGIFNRNKYIRVTFDDVEVKRHPSRANFYGVTLRQNWKAMRSDHAVRYQDDGYVFLLWEFPEDGGHPVVHVRTWQPDQYQGRPLNDDQMLGMDDFFIPTKDK